MSNGMQKERFGWAYLVMVIASALAIGVLAAALLTRSNDIQSAQHAQCVSTHILIQKILLRTLDATYEQYQADPGAVLARYRVILEANPQLHGNEAQIDKAVSTTRDILDLSDPTLCP